jgi:DNA recombination protein RmuC
MLYALLALQTITLLALIVLLLRRPAGPPEADDSRLAQLLDGTTRATRYPR